LQRVYGKADILRLAFIAITVRRNRLKGGEKVRMIRAHVEIFARFFFNAIMLVRDASLGSKRF
jgi:hypothetical protein